MSDKFSIKFMDTWLRRTRRELAVSGRISELAILMDGQQPLPIGSWRQRLYSLLSGEWTPSPDDIIVLDGALSRPRKKSAVLADAMLPLW